MRALVRRPGPRLHEGIVTSGERQPIDGEAARRQWEGYVAAMVDHGWDVVEVAPADDCPDAVFVEDTAVMLGAVALICRPGARVRRPEVGTTAATLAELGYDLRRLTPPATLDGGDVLKVDDTVYVGLSRRTNRSGVRELSSIAVAAGYRVVTVLTTKVLHLKSAVTALPDGTVIGYPELVDDVTMFPRFLAMPEEAGAAVVNVGRNRLLLSAAAVRSAELLAERGYEPIPVEIGEFEKLDGCVTCLSVRLRVTP